MNINFFEEYPTPENMAKLELITWPSTILVAAPSLVAFEEIRSLYSARFPHITFGWWPTIPGSYWVSGISNPSDLDRLFSELTSKTHTPELPILLDLELPLQAWKYSKNLFHMRSNKKKITEFIKNAPHYNIKIYSAEYPAPGTLLSAVWKWFGLSPSFDLPHTKLKMCYSSMGKEWFGMYWWNKIMKFESKNSLKHPGRTGFGLGTIATGVLGNEPILSAEDLKKDIAWARESEAVEVFIFRLGGMTPEYITVLESK